MITRKDLLDAIEKCQGQKNPNANTCIKLAAYYTILDHTPEDGSGGYSYQSKPSNSEFINIIRNVNVDDVILVMDEMMDQIQVVAPKLYYETMERLTNL